MLDLLLCQQLVLEKIDQGHAADQQEKRVEVDVIDGCAFSDPALVSRGAFTQALLEITEHMAAIDDAEYTDRNGGDQLPGPAEHGRGVAGQLHGNSAHGEIIDDRDQ